MDNVYDELIASVVNKHLGVYVAKSEENIDAIGLSFLPKEIFFKIPEEYRVIFTRRYNRFAMWAHVKLKIQQIFLKYQYNIICEETFANITEDVSIEIYRYNCEGEIPLIKVLIAFLGVENYVPISKFN